MQGPDQTRGRRLVLDDGDGHQVPAAVAAVAVIVLVCLAVSLGVLFWAMIRALDYVLG